MTLRTGNKSRFWIRQNSEAQHADDYLNLILSVALFFHFKECLLILRSL